MFNMVPFRKNNEMLKRGDVFDNLFDEFFSDSFFSPMNVKGFGNGFKVDLKKTDSSYMIEADLPGIKKEDITVEYNNNYLTICAKRENSVDDTKDNYVRRERSYGEFKRSFYVDNINEENIEAKFDNGVLNLTLPKAQKSDGRKIDIN